MTSSDWATGLDMVFFWGGTDNGIRIMSFRDGASRIFWTGRVQ
jgi:hypothetical protein